MSELELMQLVQLVQSDPEAARRLAAEALQARAATDPQIATMMEVFTRAGGLAPPAAPARERARAQRIREALREMREELAELHQRNEDLGDALGACAACWGRVRDCRECRGRGRSGWREPDPALFEEFVRPAVTRRGAE